MKHSKNWLIKEINRLELSRKLTPCKTEKKILTEMIINYQKELTKLKTNKL